MTYQKVVKSIKFGLKAPDVMATYMRRLSYTGLSCIVSCVHTS